MAIIIISNIIKAYSTRKSHWNYSVFCKRILSKTGNRMQRLQNIHSKAEKVNTVIS